MNTSRNIKVQNRNPLEVSVSYFGSMNPIKVHTNSNATINDIKKLCIERIDASKYTLLKGNKKLNDIESA
jgi:hypothetical protein